jgi:tetratricopeptide (TPR) repeat protein
VDQVHLEELVQGYLSMGRYMEAMVVSRKAIQELARAWHPKFYVFIAEAYLAQGKAEPARKALEDALEIDAAFLPALLIKHRVGSKP